MIRSLKNKKKIETIFEKGFTIKEKGLLLKAYNFKDGEIKFGVSVSKKLFPSAVKRSLIKRRLREQIKSSGLLDCFSRGFSFFVVYGAKAVLSSKEIKSGLKGLVKKI